MCGGTKTLEKNPVGPFEPNLAVHRKQLFIQGWPKLMVRYYCARCQPRFSFSRDVYRGTDLSTYPWKQLMVMIGTHLYRRSLCTYLHDPCSVVELSEA